MKEWHRTAILILLLAVAVGYIIYLRTGYQLRLEELLG